VAGSRRVSCAIDCRAIAWASFDALNHFDFAATVIFAIVRSHSRAFVLSPAVGSFSVIESFGSETTQQRRSEIV
jgi:hypothetical protein